MPSAFAQIETIRKNLLRDGTIINPILWMRLRENRTIAQNCTAGKCQK